ncbi:hypothetical protein [Clostridium tertium]|uniref:hypothetical protein n=1 Tax=Clostridium tertium TaxID=1559 RepID=UPI0024B3A793|nr:hypothetical protein [Clostridium tertium]MDI9218757.1 hypothetical protein [Clostridium tertium]
MEYVDGGANAVEYWWGWAVDLSASEAIQFGDALISFNATSAGIIGGTASALASYAASRVVSTTLKFLPGSTGWGFIIGTAAYALNVLYVGTKLKNAGGSGQGATLCKNAAGYSVNVW